MEVGAVKQAFNNEVILMKKHLNQAKIQIIHKLTRKAKTLTEKKAPEKLKEKLKKKAESAVKEVLIIKKIKAKDLAKFIVTHDGELNNYLNTPDVNQDKACARLLLHKCLQEKYRSIRDRFGKSSIEDLLMSRLERRKLRKEAREKQKNKRKGKEAFNKAVNIEGTWEVEKIVKDKNIGVLDDSDGKDDNDDKCLGNESVQSVDEVDKSQLDNESGDESEPENEEEEEVEDNFLQHKEIVKDDDKSDDSGKISPNIERTLTSKKVQILNGKNNARDSTNLQKDVNKKKKEVNKNKNFNDKILKRKFNKEIQERKVQEVKVVDPFFITPTGESYLSVVEPRQPDEVKEVHKQGNRQYRRAVMFGHVPKPKPRRNDFNLDNGEYKNISNANNRFNNNYGSQKQNRQYMDENVKQNGESEKVEKLHPSWEAKKRKSGLLPFQGKKIVFDDGE
ncbi:unnamed protein product [Parnassius apollo]|uniref:(apollo) hypothetical protein n=1 Tax=Parnassius apollo TaxID=110799 RepID=A0A8S3YEX7_PARAO|nr:unnamed protein product [Parnassius apollo]